MKVNLKVSKLELLEWYLLNSGLSPTQRKYYFNNDWLNFFKEIRKGSSKSYGEEKAMLNTWFEVIEEPNYDEWVGEWCVFSDVPISSHKTIVILGILKGIKMDKFKFIPSERDSRYRYCMLLTDYQKMIKEQGK